MSGNKAAVRMAIMTSPSDASKRVAGKPADQASRTAPSDKSAPPRQSSSTVAERKMAAPGKPTVRPAATRDPAVATAVSSAPEVALPKEVPLVADLRPEPALAGEAERTASASAAPDSAETEANSGEDDDQPDPAPLPRPPAKAETFAEGDHVVYPTHGVGKVDRIATEEIAGHKLELIHITFEENRMTLRVPVAKARSAGLRKLATRKMFDEALAVLKGRARVKRTMWSRRAQEYEAKINSGDPLAIAEVVRDLHRNAGQPDQSFSERQIYEAAMDRLAAELAALDQTDKVAAAVKLAQFLKTV